MRATFYQNKYEFILNLLFFTVAFSLPFSYAFNSISIGILFLYSFIFFEKNIFFKYLNIRKVYIFYIFFFLIQLGSIYYTNDKDIGLKNVIRNILFLILPIAFINLKNKIDNNKIRIVYFGLLLGVLSNLISAYFIIVRQYINENISIGTMIRERFIDNGIYDIHVPYLAMLIVFLFIGSYKISFNNKGHINRKIRILLMVFLTLSLFMLSGVMSIIILSIFLIYLFLSNIKSKRTKVIFLVVMVITISSSFFLTKTIDKQDRIIGSENLIYRLQNIVNYSDPVRQENWKSVIKVISSNVFLGIGADGGLELLQKYRDLQSESYINKHNAHNDILEIILRYGILGLSIYLLIMFTIIKKAIITNNYLFRWFLIVFIISGLTESYLQRQVGLVFFVFFSLLFYTQNKSDRTQINQITA